MSKSVMNTELKKAGLPTNRRPTTPGEIIKDEYLIPLGVSQARLAEAMGIPLRRLNMIIKGERSVTPDTALRLNKALGGSTKFWLNLQQDVDLYDAIIISANSNINRIQRVGVAPR